MKVESHRYYIASGRQKNDLIYSNIQGLFKTSYDNYVYIITFLDNKTLRSAVYFLSNKNRPIVLIVFRSFLNKVKYEEYKYTRFRSDYDKEYDNYIIYAFYLFKGII